MLNNKTVAVVIPAYNEQSQIAYVIESMPDFVDKIIVVNDCSNDNTAEVVKKYIKDDKLLVLSSNKNLSKGKFNRAERALQIVRNKQKKEFTPYEIINENPENNRVILINHLENGKVGASIATGYLWCRDHNIDCTAVMAGDGQMDPAELESICTPIVNDEVDYVKGNRLIHKSAYLIIPQIRFLGNSILSMLTKIASGYWRISDTQTGYTAISHKALDALQLHKIYPDYGVPNDILVKLNIAYCTIKEVEIKPIYNIGEKSKMKIHKVIPKLSALLLYLFAYRLWKKYFFRDFHPLFLLYHLSFLLLLLNIPILLRIIHDLIFGRDLTYQILFAFTIIGVLGFQSLIFAMWMDILDNERLHK
ncbi:MAG: glycosyltransferase family 2 protein [bacterium]